LFKKKRRFFKGGRLNFYNSVLFFKGSLGGHFVSLESWQSLDQR
jgi:hypothetical protein